MLERSVTTGLHKQQRLVDGTLMIATGPSSRPASAPANASSDAAGLSESAETKRVRAG
jgi:hypothetical protein